MTSVLRLAPFRRLWLAQICSETGDWIRNMALLFWVYQVSNGSPLAVSIITVCEYAPILLVTPFAGVSVDRWNRVRTMMTADLMRAVTLVLIALALLTGWLPFAYLCALLAGSFQAFFDPARTAVVASAVPKENLIAANSLTQVTRNTLRVLGPMIGTGIFALIGATAAFSLDAVTFLLSALCLAGLAKMDVHATPRPRKKLWQELREGLRFTVSNGMVRPVLIAGVTLGIGLGSYNTLQIFIVTDWLQLDERYVAILNSVQGVAMLTSALVIGSLFRKVARYKLLSVGMLIIGVGIVVVAAAPSLPLAAVGRLIVGFGGTTMNIGLASLIQTYVPDEFLGRVSGLVEPLIVGTMMLSAASAGLLLKLLSIRPLLLLNGSIVILAALVALLLFRLARNAGAAALPAAAEKASR